MKVIFRAIVLLLIMSQNLRAQNNDTIEHHHLHHKNEIGIANALVYLVSEKEFAYGFHVHYVRNIKETKFGIGLGYERIFDEHKHNTIGIVGSYRPINGFGINLSPGIKFKDNLDSSIDFALHIEASYEFEINDFHIGPVVEYAYSPDDYHISLGLHIGYGF